MIVDRKTGADKRDLPPREPRPVLSSWYQAYKIGDERFPRTTIGTTILVGNAVFTSLTDKVAPPLSWGDFVSSHFDEVQIADQTRHVIARHKSFGVTWSPATHPVEGHKMFPVTKFNETYRATVGNVSHAVLTLLTENAGDRHDHHPEDVATTVNQLLTEPKHLALVSDMFSTAAKGLDARSVRGISTDFKESLNFIRHGELSSVDVEDSKDKMIPQLKALLREALAEKAQGYGLSATRLDAFIESIMEKDLIVLE
jgi:hypothetical protein